MKDFNAAKELFKDTIDLFFYFDSISAEIAKEKIEDAIIERNASLVFIIGDSGVGKSYILKLINEVILQVQLTILIEHPLLDKRDLLKILYEAKGLLFDKDVNFNTLKDKLLTAYEGANHTVFIDEAQLFNEGLFELIGTLSDSKVFQFVFSMRQEESTLILQKKYFKARTKIVIEHGNLETNEILRYIQSLLVRQLHGEIASMFTTNEAKIIGRYTKGNFRTIKKFLYVLMKLLAYAKKNGLVKYQKINDCLLTMVALDIGLISDK